MQKNPSHPIARAARTTHTMKAGESLASIALKHYGDARYARLISTINRGDIPTRCDGFSNFAFVSPGQVVALPTYEEANIFSRHFFTKQSHSKFDLAHFARPAMPSDSIPVSILPSQGSRYPKDLSVPSIQHFMLQAAKVPISGVPSSGFGLASVASSQFDCQYIVKMPTFKTDQEVIDMAPPTVRVNRLEENSGAPEKPEVISFSHSCRMIKFEAEGGQSDTIIKLQVLEETRWQTITAYIITEQTSRRLAHYADKHNQAINIDLPCEVARELSISDLKRNWKEYVQCYKNAQEKIASFASAQENSLLQAC